MKKTIKTLLVALANAKVRVGHATHPGGYYVEIPSKCDPTRGITTESGATGVLYPLERQWEVHSFSDNTRAGSKLRRLIEENLPKGWTEFHPPSFSDIVRDPRQAKGLYGPQPCTSVN